MGLPTGYRRPDGSGGTVDIGMDIIEKSYLIDRYPELAGTFKQAGLWVWGRNQSGQLGDNTVSNKSSPVQTIAGGTNWKQVACGIAHTAAIKTDGTLWLWGSNSYFSSVYGYLGDNTSVNKSSPVQTVAVGTNWKQVSAFGNVTAIKTDGTLWTWGVNSYGQLGDNTTVDKSSPVQTIAGGTNWKQVSSGSSIAAAIKTDGTLWSWGYNVGGALGDNTTINRSSPVQTIAGGTNWKQVACGYLLTAAIKTDGTLWTWGYNLNGQLGDNTTVNKSSPVQTISGGNNWKQITFSERHAAAIKTDGTLWLWGQNNHFTGAAGWLGDNTTVDKSSPVQTISGGTNWKQVACGTGQTAAIKTDGTLWTWGYNNYGQLGDNTILPKSSPVQTIAGGTNWKQVACSREHISAICDESSDPI